MCFVLRSSSLVPADLGVELVEAQTSSTFFDKTTKREKEKKKKFVNERGINTMATTITRNSAILSVLALTLTAAIDTESPNAPIPKPECNPNITVSTRYSESSARLYIESADGITRGGCTTLSKVWVQQGGNVPPLYAVDPVTGAISDTATATWLLTEDLYIQDGVTLEVRRTRLFLQSCFVLLT